MEPGGSAGSPALGPGAPAAAGGAEATAGVGSSALTSHRPARAASVSAYWTPICWFASAAAEAHQQIGVQYALTLAARAGRWEVRALDPTPAVASAPPAAAGAPGPSAGEPALPPGSIPTGQPSR